MTVPVLEAPERHLSHGFYRVSERTARTLAAQYPARYSGRPAHGSAFRMRKLPAPGYELHVAWEGVEYYLTRTQEAGRLVWAVYRVRPGR